MRVSRAIWSSPIPRTSRARRSSRPSDSSMSAGPSDAGAAPAPDAPEDVGRGGAFGLSELIVVRFPPMLSAWRREACADRSPPRLGAAPRLGQQPLGGLPQEPRQLGTASDRRQVPLGQLGEQAEGD